MAYNFRLHFVSGCSEIAPVFSDCWVTLLFIQGPILWWSWEVAKSRSREVAKSRCHELFEKEIKKYVKKKYIRFWTLYARDWLSFYCGKFSRSVFDFLRLKVFWSKKKTIGPLSLNLMTNASKYMKK